MATNEDTHMAVDSVEAVLRQFCGNVGERAVGPRDDATTVSGHSHA